MIPYGRQQITQQDINAVVETLKSDFLTQGPKVEEFEDKLCEYVNAEYSCVTNSATSALHIACLALNVSDKSLVWTTPNTFVATANCARYCNAAVDFVDIDKNTYNLCPVKLKQKLTEHKKLGKQLPDVVIPVHFSGQSCDMEAIHQLSVEFGFSLIEDASHAVGAKYKNQHVGSCRYSDITIFSFHPVKLITTGEGGVALTNDKKLYKRLKLFCSHGVTRDQNMQLTPNENLWYYEQIDLGLNYRMTDIQAALGISQLSRLKESLIKRHEIVQTYNTQLSNLPIKLPSLLIDCESSWHLYTIQIDNINYDRNLVFKHLRNLGIGVNVHYIPVHTQPYYQQLGFQLGDFPVAENYASQTISLPLYPHLSKQQQLEVIDALKTALERGKI